MKRLAHPMVLLGLLLATSLLLDLVHFHDAFRFHGDHERDLRLATLLARHGVWPESSPSISPLPFELGPVLYLLMAPGVAISPDPLWVRVYFLLLAAGGVALLVHGWRRSTSWPAALYAGFALVSSSFWFETTSQLWHSSLLPLPLAVLFWAAGRLLTGSPRPARDAALVAGAAAVAFQLHVTAVTYLLLGAGVLLRCRKDLGTRGMVRAGLVGLALMAPFLFRFVQALTHGALAAMGNSGAGYRPAGPLTVLRFFYENVQSFWGDKLGPLLTVPHLALMALGLVVAFRRPHPIARLLAANLALGFVVEALLLGNQAAHRYMHANLYAAFGLVAVGLQAALARLPRAAAPALAAVAAGVAALAWATPTPRVPKGGWLNAEEQRDVAAVIEKTFPLPEEAMEQRIHGIYFGETMGMGHLHELYRVADAPPFSESEHVLVMPSDLGLEPLGTRDRRTFKVKGEGRTIAVFGYTPALDLSALTITGPKADAFRQKWRRAVEHAAPEAHDPLIHVATVPVRKAGTLHLVLSEGRSERDRCTVAASLDGHAVAVSPVSAPEYARIVIQALEIPAPGTLTLRIGPCPGVTFFDLW